ncbi:hypothetical protein NDU88_006350 [Pleurodeles waltl]|uniref:Uncharacterized protein n=1 Tax=Pleurodeles waltl TaxID=8319 RepID=A0AAV7VMI6_PLEWA|nr:hypothetical protein NDU88_006350 [Pleurodeles waltl]
MKRAAATMWCIKAATVKFMHRCPGAVLFAVAAALREDTHHELDQKTYFKTMNKSEVRGGARQAADGCVAAVSKLHPRAQETLKSGTDQDQIKVCAALFDVIRYYVCLTSTIYQQCLSHHHHLRHLRRFASAVMSSVAVWPCDQRLSHCRNSPGCEEAQNAQNPVRVRSRCGVECR